MKQQIANLVRQCCLKYPPRDNLESNVDRLGHTATHCNTLQHTATHCNPTSWSSAWSSSSSSSSASSSIIPKYGSVSALSFQLAWPSPEQSQSTHNTAQEYSRCAVPQSWDLGWKYAQYCIMMHRSTATLHYMLLRSTVVKQSCWNRVCVG